MAGVPQFCEELRSFLQLGDLVLALAFVDQQADLIG